MSTQPAFLFNNWPALAAVAASSSATGYSASDILAMTDDTSHRFSASGDNVYVVDASEPITADCFAIHGSGFNGLTFEISGSANNIDWTVISSTTLTANPLDAWLTFTEATYRYWRLTFTSAPSNMDIAGICLTSLAAWPYFEEGWDADNMQISGEQLVSSAGYYAGGVTHAALREMPITPGWVTPAEYAAILAFANTVIRYQTGCFFVPQIGASEVYFGWMLDKKFSAVNDNNGYTVAPLTFTTRGA